MLSLLRKYKLFLWAILIFLILKIFLSYNYLLFHTFAELISIVVAFSLFIITWNSREQISNQFLVTFGIAALFIAILDTFHTLAYTGMPIFPDEKYYANQFWIGTRFLESLAVLFGFIFLKRNTKLNFYLLFLALSAVAILLSLSILYWGFFPVCYIKDVGQTTFKVVAEYVIIGILGISLFFIFKNKNLFEKSIFGLIVASIVSAIITEFAFTLYISNYGISNQVGHFFKLITFFLIYKANIEKGFTEPNQILFKRLNESNEKYKQQSDQLAKLNIRNIEINKQLEEHLTEIKTLNEDLEEKNNNLKELNATKDRLFSIIGHDLKNPFNTLLGFNQILVKRADKYTPEKIKEIAKNMHNVSNRAYILLENLLNWSRIQTNRLNPSPKTLSAKEIVEEIIMLTSSSAKAKEINLSYDVEDKTLYADEEMLKTVLRNLTTNAIKFTHQNGEIKISAKAGEENILFSIEDNGVGMTEEQIENLFKVEENNSTNGTNNEKGSGLGLILCKEFIEKNAGKLHVESSKNKGSKFSFTVPLSN